ncbi:hypothetical protein TNCV_3876111 [Trichonephila clavipes]|uniref:Uncharacterized protein n=1 Tax=Trichonephila clavipes TaxID=2585209 RepID=A0A8X6VR53_TRICX|nr:hypothetical protein TNCV_3876111 [Trichonephila clavipes]
MTDTLPPLLDSMVGGGTSGRRCLRVHMDPMLLRQGTGLVLPTLNIDTVSALTQFLLISLPNNDMSKISPFVNHKTLIGIGGEPKSAKRLLTPHKSLNSCHGVNSEPDLLGSPDSEILEGFSDQGVTQCVKGNSRNRRKRPKVQEPEIEINMAPHRPRKSAPTEYAIDEEDTITYDVEEEELEPHPTVKFALKESPTNYPKGSPEDDNIFYRLRQTYPHLNETRRMVITYYNLQLKLFRPYYPAIWPAIDR